MEENKHNRRIDVFLLISALFHIIILLALSDFLVYDYTNPTKPIEVELFEREEPKVTKQIVDIPELAPREKPEETKYLSEHYQKVEKETQAKEKDTPQQTPQQTQLERREIEEQEQEIGKEEEGERQAKKKEEPLKTKLESSDKTVAVWRDDNYLPDIPKDNFTYINAEAFSHTRYFVEIKRKVALTWNPRGALVEYFNQGISIEKGVLSVTLGITLNPDGTIYHVAVLKPSGVQPYDKECIRSFRDSSPFTSPPEELLSPDGKLRFQFGFFVYGS